MRVVLINWTHGEATYLTKSFEEFQMGYTQRLIHFGGISKNGDPVDLILCSQVNLPHAVNPFFEALNVRIPKKLFRPMQKNTIYDKRCRLCGCQLNFCVMTAVLVRIDLLKWPECVKVKIWPERQAVCQVPTFGRIVDLKGILRWVSIRSSLWQCPLQSYWMVERTGPIFISGFFSFK